MYSLLVDENVLTKSHVFRQIIEKHFGELIPFEKCNKTCFYIPSMFDRKTGRRGTYL